MVSPIFIASPTFPPGLFKAITSLSNGDETIAARTAPSKRAASPLSIIPSTVTRLRLAESTLGGITLNSADDAPVLDM
ncbi:hypothetical protein [Paracoccus sp. SJTW-4]|uniref:hypothetical protein n=1 Tax=Paracoccus sp. SJTW-4 TaxID=3078428 RepID=UPI0039E8CB19